MTVLSILLIIIILGILKRLFVWSPIETGEYYKRKPLFFGHRGAPIHQPENTISSYKYAVKQGVPALEMDVLMTRDGKIVCSHNFDLDRETNVSGYIDEMLHRELEAIKTGVRSHPDRTEYLPLLEEAIKEIPQTIQLNIEIKSRSIFNIRAAIKVAGMIKKGDIPHLTMVSSFNPFVIWAVKWIDPSIITGFILETMDYFSFVNWVHPDCLNPEAELVTSDLLKYARDRNLKVNVWTVNTKPGIQWLLEQGVDGIITDYPEYILS